jgi:hypothetical protein
MTPYCLGCSPGRHSRPTRGPPSRPAPNPNPSSSLQPPQLLSRLHCSSRRASCLAASCLAASSVLSTTPLLQSEQSPATRGSAAARSAARRSARPRLLSSVAPRLLSSASPPPRHRQAPCRPAGQPEPGAQRARPPTADRTPQHGTTGAAEARPPEVNFVNL